MLGPLLEILNEKVIVENSLIGIKGRRKKERTAKSQVFLRLKCVNGKSMSFVVLGMPRALLPGVGTYKQLSCFILFVYTFE